MSTRNVKANIGTQVNGTSVGVLVHPGENPPIVRLDGIKVDLGVKVSTLSSSLPDVENRVICAVVAEHNNIDEIFYCVPASPYPPSVPEQIEVDDTVYYKFIKYGDSSTVMWSPNFYVLDPSDPGAPYYLYEYDETDVTEPIKYYADVVYKFSVEGVFVQKDTNLYSSVDYNGEFYTITTNVVGNLDTLQCGYVVIDTTAYYEDVVFTKLTEGVTPVVWSNSDFEQLYGALDLVTFTETPEVGEELYWNLDMLDFNNQTVKELVYTEIPQPIPVDCTVSYSVDGETWTEHSDTLTDDNNVICNIPRYMYLKFSQDVEITEE